MFLSFRYNSRGAHYQGAVPKGLLKACDNGGVAQNIPSMLGPLVGLVGQRARVQHEELGESEVPHRPRYGAHVTIVHGGDQNYSICRHIGELKNTFLLNADVVWHAAVKLAYDGRPFIGSQRQPEGRTVESETITALQRIGAITSPEESRFFLASRTDRGVSALGNVAAFKTSFSREALLRALNAAAKDVLFYAWAEVPDTFKPRRARERWYRYLLPSHGLDVEAVKQCATLLEGRHDFRRFCKPNGRPTVRTLNSIEIEVCDGIIVVDLRAREFLHNMVRRMVAAMTEVGAGRVSLEAVSRALEGEAISFGLAPPEPLTLMDVSHDIVFNVQYPPTLRRKVAAYQIDVLSRSAFVQSLCERLE